MFIPTSRTITISYLLELIRLDPNRFLRKIDENQTVLNNPIYQPQILRMIQFQNNADLFQCLIEKYSDSLLSACVDGNTILHIACIQVWEKSVQWIILRYPEMCRVRNNRGLEPFWEAFYACNYEMSRSNLCKKYFQEDLLLKLFFLNPRVAETESSYLTVAISKPGWNIPKYGNWNDLRWSQMLLNPTTLHLVKTETQFEPQESIKNPNIEHSAINIFYLENTILWNAFTKQRTDILFSTQNTAKMFYVTFRITAISETIQETIQKNMQDMPTITNANEDDSIRLFASMSIS